MTDDRATSWSVTWYPPTDSLNEVVSKREIDAYVARDLPPGWQVTGQMEQCPTTMRYHYQGYLKTTQSRKAAVIKMMDKAHIEKAYNAKGLERYVHKQETRVAEIATSEKIPTLFEYQGIIANKWREEEYKALWDVTIAHLAAGDIPDTDEVAMRYLDKLVADDIESGRRGAEFIAINPMWRSSWKRFWRSIIKRNVSSSPPCTQDAQAPSGTQDEADAAGICDGSSDAATS